MSGFYHSLDPKRKDELRRKTQRWFMRHPVELIRRAWSWWRWKRVPPWRLTWSQLAIINPAPLDPIALAGLRSLIDDDDPAPKQEAG